MLSPFEWWCRNFILPDICKPCLFVFLRNLFYLTQFLKDQTGKSFTEYVEELRLSRAMELLRGSELGITEISVQCGFSTQNTFYKAFRRRFGISPSAVRRGDNAG